jgi:hypothetical protein
VFILGESPSIAIDDIELDFENTPVKIVASRNIQELRVSGRNIGPIEEGKEVETRYWIASQLIKAGLASVRDEAWLNFNLLYKIHWKETKLQTGRRITALPEYFYPKLRRYLSQLKESATTDTSRANEYTNVQRLANDILNCRLKKIVSLSSAPAQTEDILLRLSKEEQILYKFLHSVISKWRKKILKE